MLEVSNLDVFYGKSQALRDVSLRVDEGEIVALVGANGAGKTTLLNSISGLVRPASGSVEFLGQRIDRLAPHKIMRLGISQIPGGRKLFSNMTVGDNLEMGAYASTAGKEKKETLEQVYQIFPVLKERRKQSAKKLSGGEQQMVAIGRGLMSNLRLCMFDEPSHGLAPKMIVSGASGSTSSMAGSFTSYRYRRIASVMGKKNSLIEFFGRPERSTASGPLPTR